MERWRRPTDLAPILVTLAVAALALAVLTDNVTEHDGLTRDDASTLRAFTSHRPRLLVSVAKVTTAFGSFPVLVAVAVLAGVALHRRGAPRLLLAAPALALAVTSVATNVMKNAIGRQRPPTPLHLVTASQPAFPSGHSSESAATYISIGIVLAHLVFRGRMAKIAAVATGAVVTAAVGISRLVLGVHWPTDVVAGWALGTFVAVAVTTGLRRPMPSQASGP